MTYPQAKLRRTRSVTFFIVEIFEREHGQWTRRVDSFKSKDYASKDEAYMLAEAVLNEFLDKYPCTTTTKVTFEARKRTSTPLAKPRFVPI